MLYFLYFGLLSSWDEEIGLFKSHIQDSILIWLLVISTPTPKCVLLNFEQSPSDSRVVVLGRSTRQVRQGRGSLQQKRAASFFKQLDLPSTSQLGIYRIFQFKGKGSPVP